MTTTSVCSLHVQFVEEIRHKRYIPQIVGHLQILWIPYNWRIRRQHPRFCPQLTSDKWMRAWYFSSQNLGNTLGSAQRALISAKARRFCVCLRNAGESVWGAATPHVVTHPKVCATPPEIMRCDIGSVSLCGRPCGPCTRQSQINETVLLKSDHIHH